MHRQRPRPRLLRPDRLRTVERPFGWIPFRILSSGWLQRLCREAKLLYFFLCLVADGRGVSFYGDARLCRRLGLSAVELTEARDELCHLDLLAFNGFVYQLLSLPAEEATPRHEPERKVGAKPKPAVCRRAHVEHIREILRRLSDER